MDRLLLAEILQYYKDNKHYLSVNRVLFEIYNRKMKKYLEERVLADAETENAKKQILSRLSTVNILTKLVDKLSKVYLADVRRKNKEDIEEIQQLIDNMEWKLKLDKKMAEANRLFNVSGCVAVELIQLDEENILRILPAHTFLPFSNHPDDDTILTHFIKIIDDETLIIYDENYWYEVKNNNVIAEQEHGLGRIPFVYINSNEYMLKPFEDEETLNMVLLLPLMLTDLNFALKFQSHAIVYGINVDATDLQMSPNSFWSFQSTGMDGDKPMLGTIKPEVDSEKMLATIQTQFQLWLDTKNIKTQGFGAESRVLANLSGIAKAIDNADINDTIEKQIEIFKMAEYDLFDLFTKMHNSGLLLREYEYQKDIGEDFDPLLIFNRKPELIETKREKIEAEALKLDKKLTSRKRALLELYPDYTETEIENLLKEIDEDNTEDKSQQEGLEDGIPNTNTNSSQNTNGLPTGNTAEDSEGDNQ